MPATNSELLSERKRGTYPLNGPGTNVLWLKWAVLAWAMAIIVFHVGSALAGRPLYRRGRPREGRNPPRLIVQAEAVQTFPRLVLCRSA